MNCQARNTHGKQRLHVNLIFFYSMFYRLYH